MGATNIHYRASKSEFNSAREAYRSLVDDALHEDGHDPYNGTISTCTLAGKIREPENDEDYDKILDRIEKRECKYYETDDSYVFIGWAAC